MSGPLWGWIALGVLFAIPLVLVLLGILACLMSDTLEQFKEGT